MLLRARRMLFRGIRAIANKASSYETTPGEFRSQIKASGLFDERWYLETYPDALRSRSDPLTHYLRRGWREGYSPGPLFDSAWYITRHLDVARDGIEPLQHFVFHGALEGREINARGATLWTLGDSIGPRARDAIIVANYIARVAQPILTTAAERAAINNAGWFDACWYRAAYPELDPEQVTLDSYLDTGWLDGRSPGPDFDLIWYIVNYSDIASAGQHPLAHYVTRGASQGRLRGIAPGIEHALEDLQASTCAFEPEIGVMRQFRDWRFTRLVHGRANGPAGAALAALFASFDRPYDHIVFIPWLIRGGADRVAANAVAAVEARHGPGSALVVVTDSDSIEALDWLPPTATLRSFAKVAPDLGFENRVELVTALIEMLRPAAILIVNSHAAWEAVARHGRALREVSALHAMLFCRDFTPDGRAFGYSDTHARRCLPVLSRIYFDNGVFETEFADRLGLPMSMRAKLSILRQPATEGGAAPRRPRLNSPFRALWASRLCRQKNVDLLLAIARAAPELLFDVYGIGEKEETAKLVAFAASSGTLAYRGGFSSFETLPIADAHAFLYTSLWDGLPNVLLAAAHSGLPIVASLVGGVGELVDADTGWPIADAGDPAPYVVALREIRDRPDEAARRVERMTERVMQRHSWDHYIARFAEPPSFLDPTP
jgi:glycosyltransferase involved in cell wall biosynthesis